MLLEVNTSDPAACSNPLRRCGNTIPSMPKKRAAELLAENLLMMMASDPNLSNGPKLAKASGVSQKTINNIVRGRFDTQLSSIEKIAKAFRTEAYIFLTPSDESLLPILLAYAKTDSRGRELLNSAADAVLISNGRTHKAGGSNE